VISAWTAAKTAAQRAGVTLCLNDGKRSAAQQRQTYASYVAQFGEAAAQEYVLPPEKSAHVLGYAIDVQPAAGARWLEQTAGQFGLCRMYDNEAWHFEFAQTFTLGCPPRRARPGA
jgi:LAS superfamily LD-carboxypeptidase LdcB